MLCASNQAPGCHSLTKPANGELTFLTKRIYAKFKCNPGYVLNNSNKEYIYCDGNYWNSTKPDCIGM